MRRKSCRREAWGTCTRHAARGTRRRGGRGGRGAPRQRAAPRMRWPRSPRSWAAQLGGRGPFQPRRRPTCCVKSACRAAGRRARTCCVRPPSAKLNLKPLPSPPPGGVAPQASMRRRRQPAALAPQPVCISLQAGRLSLFGSVNQSPEGSVNQRRQGWRALAALGAERSMGWWRHAVAGKAFPWRAASQAGGQPGRDEPGRVGKECALRWVDAFPRKDHPLQECPPSTVPQNELPTQ